jgi:site-specific recombinase XerD
MTGATKYLTRDQVTALADQAKARARSPRNRHRDRLMLLMAWHHGIRVSTLAKLKWGTHVRLDAGQIIVPASKKGNPSTHRLTGDEIRGLRRVKTDWAENGGFVFVSERGSPFTREAIRKMMALAGEKAGLPAELCHPHALRHGAGHFQAAAGIDTRRIQDWLGHKRIDTTQIYTDLSGPDKFTSIDALYE